MPDLLLALVNRKRVTDPEGFTFWRPDLPASLDRGHGWGQASSLWEPRGQVLTYVTANGPEADAILATPGSSIKAECAKAAEIEPIIAAMRRQTPNWANYANARSELKKLNANPRSAAYAKAMQAYERESATMQAFHRNPVNEFLSAYRGPAEMLERDLLLEGQVRTALIALSALGIGVALTLIAKWFGPAGYALAATLAADNFNRSNRSLDGDTMSDGSNTWALDNATGWDVVSNMAQPGGNDASEYCDSMADTADVFASVTFASNAKWGSVFARRVSGRAFYGAGGTTSGTYMYVRKFTSGTITDLTSAGSALADGQVIGVMCEGTSISGYINGSLDVGPATDSTHSTGKAGMWAGYGGLNWDDFLVESLAASGAISGSTAGTSTVSGTLSGAGALSGSAAGSSTASGTVAGSGALAGTAAGAAAASGTLTGAGTLSGAAAGVASVVGTLTGEGALAGAAAGTSTVGGTLQGAGALSGAAAGLAGATGVLAGTGALSGAAAGTCTVSGTLIVPVVYFAFALELSDVRPLATVSDVRPAVELVAKEV